MLVPVDGYKYLHALPIVSIALPFLGLTHFITRVVQGNPKKRNYNGDYAETQSCRWTMHGFQHTSPRAFLGSPGTSLPCLFLRA